MKSTLFFLGCLPVLAAIAVGWRFRFRLLPTMTASVAGELVGLLLYADYNRWRLSSVLSGTASGAVGYVGTDAPREPMVAILAFCAWGAILGITTWLVRTAYLRLRP